MVRILPTHKDAASNLGRFKTADKVEDLLEAYRGTYPGAVVLVRVGDETRVVSGGHAVVGEPGAVTAAHRFPVASVTKTMVATAVLQLVQEGKLSLSDSVESWLPGMVPRGDRISVEQLLAHRSGLYNYTDSPSSDWTPGWDPREILRLATSEAPVHAPDTQSSYSNLDALLSSDGVDARQFWWGWRHHGDKLDSMQAYAAAFIEDLDELSFDRLATGAHRIGAQKLSALYVDFNDGQILVPDRVSESDAADLLLRNRRSIDHLRAALAGLSAEVVEAAHTLGPVLEIFFGQVIDARAPQEVLAELRQLVHSLPDMTGDEISSLLISRMEEAGRSGPET